MKKNIFLCIAVFVGAISTSWIAPETKITHPVSKYKDLEDNVAANVTLMKTFYFNLADPALGTFDQRNANYNSEVKKLLLAYKVARKEQYKKTRLLFSGSLAKPETIYHIDKEIYEITVSDDTKGKVEVYIGGKKQTMPFDGGDFRLKRVKPEKEKLTYELHGKYSDTYVTKVVEEETEKIVNRLVEDGLINDMTLIYKIE